MTWLTGPAGDPDDDLRVLEHLADVSRAIDATLAVSRARPVVAAAWARTIGGNRAPESAGADVGAAPPRVARPPLGLRLPRLHAVLRPLAASGLALAIASGTVAASSRPGAPLYGTRLAVEQALMPVAGSTSRAAAELDYADRRLDEARDGLARGDRDAAIAALGAYQAAIGRLASDGREALEAEPLEGRLARDVDILETLRWHAPDAATASALTGAIHEIAAIAGRHTERMPHGHPRLVGPKSPRNPGGRLSAPATSVPG